MEVDSADRPEVTFRIDGETYIMMMYGRLTPDQVISKGKVAADGYGELVTSFKKRFVGG